MKQGSTFVLIIDLDIDIGRVDSIIFTLKNKGNILTKEDWNFSDGKFKIPFTQEETVRLIGRTLIEAQVNFKDGNVSKSDIKEIFIKESLATKIIDKNNATDEHGEIELVIDGDVVYQGEDYTYLVNKPKINGVVLAGNVSPDALNLATKEYVEREIATFDFIKIVDELPEVGLPNREYFVRKQIPNQNDLFDEWAWINNDWEFKGTKTIEVDLLEYVKKDELNVASTKIGSNSKYVATAGLFKYDGGGHGGIFKSTAGGDTQDTFRIKKADHNTIDNRTPSNYHDAGVHGGNHCQPITPAVLDYAVKKALSDCKLEGDDVWTEDEKASVRDLLGIIEVLNTMFQTVTQDEYDVLVKQGEVNENTYYYIKEE